MSGETKIKDLEDNDFKEEILSTLAENGTLAQAVQTRKTENETRITAENIETAMSCFGYIMGRTIEEQYNHQNSDDSSFTVDLGQWFNEFVATHPDMVQTVTTQRFSEGATLFSGVQGAQRDGSGGSDSPVQVKKGNKMEVKQDAKFYLPQGEGMDEPIEPDDVVPTGTENIQQEGINILYNAILNIDTKDQNYVNDKTAFVAFDPNNCVFIDGDTEDTVEGSKFEAFLDENGKEIKFPNFVSGNSEFYIKFKPGNNGNVFRIKPRITIGLLANWEGTFSVGEIGTCSGLKVTFTPGDIFKKEVAGTTVGVKVPSGYTVSSGDGQKIAEWNVNNGELPGFSWPGGLYVGQRFNYRPNFGIPVDGYASNAETVVCAQDSNDSTIYIEAEVTTGKSQSLVEVVKCPEPFTLRKYRNITIELKKEDIPEERDPNDPDKVTKPAEHHEWWEITNIDENSYQPYFPASNKFSGEIDLNPDPRYIQPIDWNITTGNKELTDEIPGEERGRKPPTKTETPYYTPWYDYIMKYKGIWKFYTDQVDTNLVPNIQLGGTVWYESIDEKTANKDDKFTGEDDKFEGIQVQLYDYTANGDKEEPIAVTTTDKNGNYRFYGKYDGKFILNPLHNYYVKFVYNGLMYEPTKEYQDKLAQADGQLGFSNAKEISREKFNETFDVINSDKAGNYGENTRAYGLELKIQNDDGEYVPSEKYPSKALRYKEVWEKFKEFAAGEDELKEPKNADGNEEWPTKGKASAICWENAQQSYSDKTVILGKNSYKDAFDKLKAWLNGIGIKENTSKKIITFMKDSMIVASTTRQIEIVYPAVNSKYKINDIENPTDDGHEFRTYTTASGIEKDVTFENIYEKTDHIKRQNSETIGDQSRYVDFGLFARKTADIAIGKDLYKLVTLINGEKETYIYNKKELKDDDGDGNPYWEVNSGDPLYQGDVFYERKIKESDYLYTGSDDGDSGNGTKALQAWATYKIMITNQGSTNIDLNEVEIADYYDAEQYEFDGENGGFTPKVHHDYDYKTKKTTDYVGTYLGANGKGENLDGSETSTGGLKISDEPKSNNKGENTQVGDYKILYLTGLKSENKDDILKPGEWCYVYITFKAKPQSDGRIKLDQDLESGKYTVGKRNIAEINSYSMKKDGKAAGLIDNDSNPGSLSNADLETEDKKKGNIKVDKGNDLKDRREDDTDQAPNLKIVLDRGNIRKLKGIVYEDLRTKNASNAVIGDGEMKGNDPPINGVTVQLVELVRKTDGEGYFTGDYTGEKVLCTYNYAFNGKTLQSEPTKDTTRYASGSGQSKVILSGGGIFGINPDEVGKGEYEFESIYPGDFYIRFIYGDTVETVLASDSPVSALVGGGGKNAKSYNGQDYKSTTYQDGIDQKSIKEYNDIKGYTDYENQNYQKIDDLDVYDKIFAISPKDKMYVYGIKESDVKGRVSDAKDVYDYREIVNSYSDKEVLNYKAETLASFEKLASDSSKQAEMLKEFMDNTKMVAQTGIINVELKNKAENGSKKSGSDKQSTEGAIPAVGEKEEKPFVIDKIDLGLVERPRAQLTLKKEVKNFSITLANGQPLFNTNTSVKDLHFDGHKGHNIKTNRGLITGVVLSSNATTKPELIQAYMDDELLQGATMNVLYGLTVKNVGETDYLGKEFYYTGNPSGAVSTTKVLGIVDYVTNNISFDSNNKNNGAWTVVSPGELTGQSDASNFVNKSYKDLLETYNTIIKTKDINADLTPGTQVEIPLELSTELSASTSGDNLIYNNLAEIVSTSNTQGRRMQFSIVGNQKMADQSLGDNAASGAGSKDDLITPKEVDADSAQKIVIMPPTGENKNYIPVIVTTIIGTVVIIGAVLLIKKYGKKAEE